MFSHRFGLAGLALATILALSSAQKLTTDGTDSNRGGNLRSSNNDPGKNNSAKEKSVPAINLSAEDGPQSLNTHQAINKMIPPTLASTDTSRNPDEIKRVVVKCDPALSQDDCIKNLMSSSPQGSVKVIHSLERTNSVAVGIHTSKISEFARIGFDMHDDPPRYTHKVAESIEHENRKLASQTVPYGIQMVHAPDVWQQYNVRGEGVKVCVIDTGLMSDHPDFTTSNLSGYSGSNAVTPWNQDGVGHGTHVSGTIAAADNSIGVVGVAPNAEIYMVRVFDQQGVFASDIVSAAEACSNAGANIISMSLGGPQYSTEEQNTFDALFNQGILSVAAAGNSGGTDLGYPAAYNNVVSVAAVDRFEVLASFSTRNNMVDIAAPGKNKKVLSIVRCLGIKRQSLILLPLLKGVNVESTWNDGSYKTISGTSMATPHVSGVAALLKSFKPDATATDLVNALTGTAIDKGPPGRDNGYGYGIVDALAAIQQFASGNSGSSPPGNSNTPSPTNPGTNSGTSSGTSSGSNCANVVLSLTTDNYASETSYTLTDTSTGELLWSTNGANLLNNQSYVQESCVDPNSCYRFEIADSFGDGITGKGISLVFDGTTLYQGGNFGSGGYVDFGNGC